MTVAGTYGSARTFIKERGTRIMPLLPGMSLPFTQGNIWHVKPYTGSDSNYGDHPDSAFATLYQAHDAATTNQNDIVLLYSEHGSTAASSMYYETHAAGLVWSKNMVHLVGIGSGGSAYSSRAGVRWKSTATLTAATPLFTLSGNNCLVANVSFYNGLASAYAYPCVTVSGDYNHFYRVGVQGMMDTTLVNQIDGASSLKLDGADSFLGEECRIGTWTVERGNSTNKTYELLVDGGVSDVHFYRTEFLTRLLSGNTGYAFSVGIYDATAVGLGGLWFEDCGFQFSSNNFGTTAGSVFKLAAALTEGRIYITGRSWSSYATTWDADSRTNIQLCMPAKLTAGTGGLCLAST